MKKIKIKQTFNLPSEITFYEGDILWGYYDYWIGTEIKKNEETISNLSIICSQQHGCLLVEKNNLELV